MAGGNARLRPVDDLVGPAVAETVRNLEVPDEDAAAVRLAERYAAVIDEHAGCAECGSRAEVMEKVGPKLLAVLESLGATPRARALTRKGGAQRGPSRLDQLRAARGA